jgi:hypothetical protein
LKLGLDLMGICSSTMVLPFQAAENGHHEALHEILNEFDKF